MDALKGGAVYGAPRGGSPDVKGSNVATEGGKPAGWDPFEVWRTRVRDVQQARARAEDSPGKR